MTDKGEEERERERETEKKGEIMENRTSEEWKGNKKRHRTRRAP